MPKDEASPQIILVQVGWWVGNIFDVDKMLVPVHKDGSHWILIEANMKNRVIKFYDSMLSVLDPDIAMGMMGAVAQYINKEGEKKGVEGLNAMFDPRY